jgi:uncharacterized membrane protein/thiol-disulfide isomerase/thioredoxin
MRRIAFCLLVVCATLLLIPPAAPPLRAAENTVHAVLFYSPSCGHCHYVITEVLPPLLEAYGDQFEIVGVNAADPQGNALYQATIQSFGLSETRRGVPALVIGDYVLVGSLEIPERLPGLIDDYLEKGGVDWPAIPGLTEALAAAANAPTPAATGETALSGPASTSASPASSTSVPTSPSPMPGAPMATPTAGAPGIMGVGEDPGAGDGLWDKLRRDPTGNALSIIVLLAMVASLVYGALAWRGADGTANGARWRRAVPPLVAVGLVVAGYLAYVETQHVSAVCGPVGDCNTVQQSEFALLFGFLPVAVLGLLGYVGMGVAWAVARNGDGRLAGLALLALKGMAWFGLLFSIYLTFLEPFVIGATCAWCLTSAVIMTALFWIVIPAKGPALASLRGRLGQPFSA